jgi:hypothetical protein
LGGELSLNTRETAMKDKREELFDQGCGMGILRRYGAAVYYSEAAPLLGGKSRGGGAYEMHGRFGDGRCYISELRGISGIRKRRAPGNFMCDLFDDAVSGTGNSGGLGGKRERFPFSFSHGVPLSTLGRRR